MCDHYSEFDNSDYTKERPTTVGERLLRDVINFAEKKDEVFGTGSRRDSSEHKPRVSDLKAYTRERFGYHLLKGSINYGTGNFEKGQPDLRTLESLHRHLTKYELGDNQEDHLSAVIFGIQNILLNEQMNGVPTDFYYQQYVASGEYDKDVERRRKREEKEMAETILNM